MVTASFLWSRLAICSSLLVVHLQLVRQHPFRSIDNPQHFSSAPIQIKLKSNLLFQSERVPNPNDIVFNVFMALWAFVAIFGLCIVGDFVTQQFDQFYDELSNNNWYLLSKELQRMLVIFMGIAQKSVQIYGSEKVICRLETFKKVRPFTLPVSLAKLNGGKNLNFIQLLC